MEFFKPGNEVNIKVLNGDKVTEIFDYEKVFKDSYVKCVNGNICPICAFLFKKGQEEYQVLKNNLESQINVFDK